MSENRGQRIGADQLISGLPKHMEAVAGEGNAAYWEIVPGKNACATCRLMYGRRFKEKPGPVHPNCTCEIRRVVQPTVNITGLLQGYEDHETERFEAGQIITIEIRNLGPFWAGAKIQVNREEWRTTDLMRPGKSMAFRFSKFREHPVPWEVFLINLGGDNSTIQYFIRG